MKPIDPAELGARYVPPSVAVDGGHVGEQVPGPRRDDASPGSAPRVAATVDAAELAWWRDNVEGAEDGPELVPSPMDASERNVGAARQGAEPKAERTGSRGGAPGAAQPRNVHTSTNISPRSRIPSGLLPGGQLALPGHPAQLAWDGAPHDPQGPESVGPEADERPAREPASPPLALEDLPRGLTVQERAQLEFSFQAGEVSMPVNEWRQLFAEYVDYFERGTPGSAERPARLRRCGSMMAVPLCNECGVSDVEHAKVSADCESRCCPSCARKKSGEHREHLRKVQKAYPSQSRGISVWFHTESLKHDYHTSIASLQRDAEKIWKAWKTAWEGNRCSCRDSQRRNRKSRVEDYHCMECGLEIWEGLKQRGAKRAYVKQEVGVHGMVHYHALVWGPFLPPVALKRMRTAVAKVTGSPWYKIKRARKGTENELAKYFTKGVNRNDAAAKQTHPLLAALCHIAFRGARVVREYGDFEAVGIALPDNDNDWTCPHCGCGGRPKLQYVERRRFEKIFQCEVA